MRYTIHEILDEQFTGIDPRVQDESDSLDDANRKVSAVEHRSPCGAAIRDNQTGLIDYGYGFGRTK